LIDAAVAAGVKRFLPSEFGSDLGNPNTAVLPVFGYKVVTNEYVQEKAAAHSKFTYTLIRNGPFLDWGINNGFIFDWKNATPVIFGGGDQFFSATTLSSVGQAVVGVLTHPEETTNRAVYVEDIRISQNQLLKIAKQNTPGKVWSPIQVDLNDMKKDIDAKLAQGEISVLVKYIALAVFGDGFGGLFDENNDNKLLGVPGMVFDRHVFP
jgi:hypothetical protein